MFRQNFTVLVALTRPHVWRDWLLSGAPPLTEEEEQRASRHLTEAFRVLLVPLRDGTARVNPRAVRALAALGAGVTYIDS